MAVSDSQLPGLAGQFLDPRRFFAPHWTLTLRHDPAERLPWEVFQGRLLDPAHTRQWKTFSAWNLHAAGPDIDAVLLSLKFDAETSSLFLVRAVEGYAWEGHDTGGGVFESRERRKWLQELIARFSLARTDLPTLTRELQRAVHHAVVGARLPLTPVEAPLPGFTFGRLAYGPTPSAPRTADDLLRSWLVPAEAAEGGHRILEAWLRSSVGTAVPEAAAQLGQIWRDLGLPFTELIRLSRRIFDDVSLSPWTASLPLLLDVLDRLVEQGDLPQEALIDLHASLLRLLSRHLTAYDLVTFHHRGANYPDALLLDEILGRYLTIIEQAPHLFEGDAARLRRRALRQAYVVRRRYEGHPVPDVPTSPGERARVYPDSTPRVSEEQILQPARRKVVLFRDHPLVQRLGPAGRRILGQSIDDLRTVGERHELGAAVYLDRPLGGAKQPVEPDATPLFASLACSRFIAGQRLRLLGRDLGVAPEEIERLAEQLAVPGVTLDAIGPAVRPGTLTLADAARVSADFVFRSTLPGSRRAFLTLFDWSALAGRIDLARLTSEPWLMVRSRQGPGLVVLNSEYKVWLEVEPDLGQGYFGRNGVELPAAGLLVTAIDGERLAEPVRVGSI